MTTAGLDATEVFADARRMLDAALARMAEDDIRDGAEKAWCAAKRATDALILARTGELPEKSPATTRGLLTLAESDASVRGLRDRYFARQSFLHGDCFYNGLCEPVEAVHRMVRETDDYIREARRLAGLA